MASAKNKYSVLLPTYNEKENLPVIVYLIFEMAEKQYAFEVFLLTNVFSNYDFEVVIIDDNSPDGTAEVSFFLFSFSKLFRLLKSYRRCILAKL